MQTASASRKKEQSFLMRNTKAGHVARVHLSDTCRKKWGGHYTHFTFPAFIQEIQYKAHRLPCQL